MARTTDQMIIEISADNKKMLKAIEQIGSSTEKLEKNSKSLFSKLQTGWLAVAGAVLSAKKAFDFSKQFANYKQGFDALTRNSGQNADKIIDKLKEVSKGTISNRDLVLSANRSMALNVTKDVNVMANLLEIARVKAKSMGIDTTQAFNDIVTGIGRGSPLILDNLGIVTKGWDKLAKQQGVNMDTQFILNQILKQGNEELKGSGASALTSAERFQQLNATLTNLEEKIGERLLPKFETIVGILSKLFEWFIKLPPEVQNLGIALVGLGVSAGIMVKTLGLSVATVTKLSAGLLVLYASIRAVQWGMETGKKITLGWTSVLNDADLKKASKDLENYKKELEDYKKTIHASGLDYEFWVKKQIDGATRLYHDLRKKSGEKVANKFLEDQQEKLNKVRMEWSEYSSRVNNTTNAIDNYNKMVKAQADIEEQNRLLREQGSQEESTRMDEKKKSIEDYYTFLEDQRAIDQQRLDENYASALAVQAQFGLNRTALDEMYAQKSFEIRNKNLMDFRNASADAMKSVASNYSDGIANMIVTGQIFRKSFLDFMGDIISEIGRAIIKMAVFKGIMAGLDFATGGIFGSLLGGFASGTSFAPGGPAIVGERGPEIVNLPRGAEVIPNNRFNAIPAFANGGRMGDTITNSRSVMINSMTVQSNDPVDFMRQLENFSEKVNSPMFRR